MKKLKKFHELLYVKFKTDMYWKRLSNIQIPVNVFKELRDQFYCEPDLKEHTRNTIYTELYNK